MIWYDETAMDLVHALFSNKLASCFWYPILSHHIPIMVGLNSWLYNVLQSYTPIYYIYFWWNHPVNPCKCPILWETIGNPHLIQGSQAEHGEIPPLHPLRCWRVPQPAELGGAISRIFGLYQFNRRVTLARRGLDRIGRCKMGHAWLKKRRAVMYLEHIGTRGS